MENTGKAYAFFNCRSSKEKVEREISEIRNMVQTPSELELSLSESPFKIKGDEQLKALAHEAQEAGRRYLLEVTYQGAGNKKTADKIAEILNEAYLSPLYKKDEPFFGDIIYQRGEKYVFRR